MHDNILNHPFLFLSIIIGSIGLIPIIVALYYILKAKSTSKWMTTTGTIISSNIVQYKDPEDHEYSNNFKPEIIYTYRVGNKNYTSRKIDNFLDHYSAFKKRSIRLTNKYIKDSTVTVHYNPVNPDQSVLEIGINPRSKVLMCIGILIVIISFISIYYF